MAGRTVRSIELSLEVKNPDALQRHLNNVMQGIVARWLREKSDEFTARLVSEIGKPAAEGAYGSAINVTIERIPRGWQLVANGDAVGFLEFGAGVTADKNHSFAQNAPFEVYPGSWSKDHAQQFTNNGFWVFGGQQYDRVEPRRGLYKAYAVMLTDMKKIAIEVFNDI